MGLDGPAGRTSWTDLLDGPAGRTSWTDQLDGPAGQTSWTDQFFLFEALASLLIRRFSLSLYIVAASESDEGLLFLLINVLEPQFSGAILLCLIGC